MKIYASKVDDLRKARDEWDAETARRESIKNEEEKKYRKAQAEITAPIEDIIRTRVKKFNLLEFEINVTIGTYYGDRGVEVNVRVNQNKVHDADSALSWDWSVRLNAEGELVKDSGSWSGLNAISEANMNSLRQTVEALEVLNGIDWPKVLDVEVPTYSDYFTQFEARGTRPKFEQQMKEAEVEEYVGKPIALRGRGIESLGYNERSKNIWYILERETPKKFVVSAFSDNEIARSGIDSTDTPAIIERFKGRWSQQIKKEYLIAALEYPFVTLGR